MRNKKVDEEWLNSQEFREMVTVKGEARRMVYELAEAAPWIRELLEEQEQFDGELLCYVLMPDITYGVMKLIEQNKRKEANKLMLIITNYWEQYDDEGPQSARNLIKMEFLDAFEDSAWNAMLPLKLRRINDAYIKQKLSYKPPSRMKLLYYRLCSRVRS